MVTLLPAQMFPCLPARATFVADINFVYGTQKKVSDFVQKQFVSATNVSQFAQPKKHHGQQCVLVCQGLNTNKNSTSLILASSQALFLS